MLTARFLTIQAALRQGAQLLEQEAVAAPRLTAEVLLCHALGRDRSFLYGHPEEELTETAWIHYGRYLHERLRGVPTQYITRRQEFWGRDFVVNPSVLIPRPETEHVIEVALERAPRGGAAIDIGCGSGAIGITWRLETGSRTVATDISPPAASVARENARRLGAAVEVVVCDLAVAFPADAFDLVLSNPPYIPDPERPSLQREVRDHEPGVALFGGPTGVEIYERLIAEAVRVLRPGGWLVMEIGYRAEARIAAMLTGRWEDVRVNPDLAGWPRVVSARLAP